MDTNLLINRVSDASLSQSVAPQPEKPVRLKSIDIYRGITMFGMILVDNSGSTPIWPLDETEWHGISTADLIFPAFLFIMGFAVPLAIRPPYNFGKSLVRVIGLFVIGLLLNLTARKFDFTVFRIMGVLQRISICYLALILLHLASKFGKAQLQKYCVMFVTILSFVYFGVMLHYQCPDSGKGNLGPTCNFQRESDMAILSYAHMLKPTDPEGLFSTLSALLTAFGGYYFCLLMKKYKSNPIKIIQQWIIHATFCLLLSFPLSLVMPYNKKLWTTSFAFFTVGVSGISLVLLTLLVDQFIERNKDSSAVARVLDKVTQPFLWLGMNPLAIFVLMDLLGIVLIRLITIDGRSAWSYYYSKVFSSWIHNEPLCSTIFSLSFGIIWTLVAYILFKFKIFIKL